MTRQRQRRFEDEGQSVKVVLNEITIPGRTTERRTVSYNRWGVAHRGVIGRFPA